MREEDGQSCDCYGTNWATTRRYAKNNFNGSAPSAAWSLKSVCKCYFSLLFVQCILHSSDGGIQLKKNDDYYAF